MNRNHLSLQETQASLARQRKIQQRNIQIKKARKRLIIIFSFFLFVIISIFVFIAFRVDLSSFKNSKKDSNVFIQYTDDKSEQLKSSYLISSNDIFYISLDFITSKLSMTLSGDKKQKSISYADSNTNQFAEFSLGSETVLINGVPFYMDGAVLKKGNDFFVPISFFNDYIENIGFGFDETKNQYILNLPIESKQEKSSKINIIFNSLNDDPSKKATINGEVDKPVIAKKSDSDQDLTYKTDISEYEKYIDPENIDEYMILVSAQSPITEDYVPTDLVDISFTRKDRTAQKMRKYAAMALEALLKEASANGFDDISVTSGYRDFKTQQYLYNNEIELFKNKYGDKAAEMAAKSVAVPGTSEHQSGLCIDMHNLPSASEKFASEDAYKWLYSNCAKFGFILRFPNGKEDITGIVFEPWHYRYIGRTNAMKIMSKGICLEEYLISLKQTAE